MIDAASERLAALQALDVSRPVRIMNVCGGHERSISVAGLRGVLPHNVELVPGPGCPVCICPEEDVYEAIQLALHEDITLVAFGDMLRVPVNVPKREARSLEQAKAAGADIRPIASPLDAVHIADQDPSRLVVFFAAGFETTTAPVAAMLAEGVPDNLLVLLSGRLTWPAVAMLLDSGNAGLRCADRAGARVDGDGARRMGVRRRQTRHPRRCRGLHARRPCWRRCTPCCGSSMRHRHFLDNCYPEVVRPGGNPEARRQLQQVMEVVDANWRGIGVIPKSGFALREAYAAHDARQRFRSYADASRKRVGEMPPGCDCAQVVLGKIYPNQCRLYGAACTPRKPIGPCMVSDEGACRIWWSSGYRDNEWEGRKKGSAVG